MLHLLALICALLPHSRGNDYYGEYIGDFKNRLLIEIFKDSGSILNYTHNSRFHGVTGEVYAVDSRTIYIKGFRCTSSSGPSNPFFPSYDGAGPDAYFYVGERGEPSGNGIHIADDKGTLEILGSYRSEDIVLTLPGGKTLRTIRWLSVWCDAFGVNFGEVRIPRQLRYPRPQKIRAFNGIHDVSSDK